METFLYTFATDSNAVSDVDRVWPKFDTTYNGLHFSWKLAFRHLSPPVVEEECVEILMKLEKTNSVANLCQNADLLVFPIVKITGHQTITFRKVQFGIGQNSDSIPLAGGLGVRFYGNFEKFHIFSDGSYKFLLKIKIPRKNFDQFAMPVDRLILPAKMAYDLFQSVIGAAEEDRDKMSDITLISSEGSVYKCHKWMLSACSDVFKTMFQRYELGEEVKINDMDDVTMETVLCYIYKNEFNEDKLELELVENVLYIAEKYNLSDLKAKCESRFKFDLNPQKVFPYLKLAETYAMDSLSMVCLKIIQLRLDFPLDTYIAEFFRDNPAMLLKMKNIDDFVVL